MPASDSVYINIIADATKATATIAKLGAAYFAVTKIVGTAIRIGKDLVAEYQLQEIAEAKLSAAIKATGNEGLISAKNIGRLANQLQKTTTFADDMTISAAAMLQQLANLDEQGLAQIIPRVQNFAAAMGIDLEQAAALVGKTLGSSTNALGRYGIQIDADASKSAKLAQLTKELDAKFAGMAATIGITATGQIKIFENALSDLKEVAGEVILKGIGPMIQNLIPLLQRMSDSISGWKIFKSILSPEGFQAAISSLGNAKEAIVAVNEEIQRTEGLLKTLGRYRGPEEERLRQLRDRLTMLQQVIPLLDQQEKFTKKTKIAPPIDPKTIENARKLADGVQAATEAWREFISAELEIVSEMPVVNNAVLGLTDMVNEFADELMAREPDILQLSDKRIQAIVDEIAAKKVLWDQEVSARQAVENELYDISEDAAEKHRQVVNDYLDAITPLFGILDSLGTMWSNYYEGQMEGMDKESEEYKKLARKQAASEKAWALFTAMVNIAVAVTKALASTVPPFNYILAAATAVAGAVQLAAIASTPLPALAEGGVVTRPTTAFIGEAGPEAVIPLSKMGGMGTNISVYVYGSVMEEEGLARKIGSIVSRQRRGY